MKNGGKIQLDFQYFNTHNNFLLNKSEYLSWGRVRGQVNTIDSKVKIKKQFMFILTLWHIFMELYSFKCPFVKSDPC